MRLPPGCEGLRVRRRTVLWTFRRPCMGRPVPREFMRNALLDLTTLVPATAYHRRSYAERYSRYIIRQMNSDFHTTLSRIKIYLSMYHSRKTPARQCGATVLSGSC